MHSHLFQERDFTGFFKYPLPCLTELFIKLAFCFIIFYFRDFFFSLPPLGFSLQLSYPIVTCETQEPRFPGVEFSCLLASPWGRMFSFFFSTFRANVCFALKTTCHLPCFRVRVSLFGELYGLLNSI